MSANSISRHIKRMSIDGTRTGIDTIGTARGDPVNITPRRVSVAHRDLAPPRADPVSTAVGPRATHNSDEPPPMSPAFIGY